MISGTDSPPGVGRFKSQHRIFLEQSRRFRRWLSYGMALASGYVAKITRERPKPAWKEIQRSPGASFWTRFRLPSRILAEPSVSITPDAPGCIQEGNPGAFPLGKPIPSAPAFVHWLPSVIYHGFHGAIIDPDGSIYTELLDSPPGKLDMTQARERPLVFKGRVMALSCSKNYYHWLLKMLPRLHLIERSEGSLDKIEAFLVNKPTWQQEQVYRRLNIWDRCAIVDRKTFAVCRLLAAPTLAHDGPDWACRFLRERLAPPENSGPRKRIYVARGNAAHRALVNEAEVCALLQNYGFEIVDCSILSVEEQAALFAQSDVIAGVHGAALSNLAFCRPGAIVLEIFGTPKNQKGYWLVSSRMRLHYHYLMAASLESGPVENMADISIDLPLLTASIEAILRKASPLPA